MVTSSFGSSGFDGEEELRTDIQIGIQRALDDELDSRKRDLTATESEKLTYFAIRDMDLDLTFSWYLAGANTAASHASPLPRAVPTGPEIQDLDGERSSSSLPPRREDRIEEFRAYFRTAEFIPEYTLRDVWFEDRFDFLRAYYQECAPDVYRDLYLHSLDIRERLTVLLDQVETSSEHVTLNSFTDGTDRGGLLDESFEAEFRYSVSDFHVDLTAIEELDLTRMEVVRGTDLLERVLWQLTQLETLETGQRMFLNELHDFFFHYVWKYPALAVSADTAEGPNADALRQNRLLELDTFDESLRTEVRRLASRARQLGLTPDIEVIESMADDEEARHLSSIYADTITNE
jgi:hypothetical protein